MPLGLQDSTSVDEVHHLGRRDVKVSCPSIRDNSSHLGPGIHFQLSTRGVTEVRQVHLSEVGWLAGAPQATIFFAWGLTQRTGEVTQRTAYLSEAKNKGLLSDMQKK